MNTNQHFKATKKETVAHFKKMLYTDSQWAIRALLRLYEYQSEDERTQYSANHENKRGFNKVDAQLLTAFAKRIIMNEHLTYKQMHVLHSRIQKYAKQLYEISLEKMKP